MSYGSGENLEGERNLIDSERGEGLFLYLWASLESWVHQINKTLTIFPKLKGNNSPVLSLMFKTDCTGALHYYFVFDASESCVSATVEPLKTDTPRDRPECPS